MNPVLIALLTFVGVVLLVVGPYYLFVLRSETADQEMIRRRIRTGGGASRATTGVSLFKEAERFSVVGPLNRMLGGGSGLATKLRDTIQMSGLKITAGQLVFGSASVGMLAFLLVFLRSGSAVAALLFGFVMLFLPYGVVGFMRTRRIHKFEEQFPEAVDLIARALRAGHAFTTGLGMAADEMPQPVSGEFKLLFDQQNYGLPITDALKELARRVPLIDARFFVTAVLTQREAGGNLAEVLDNLSRVIRERFKIRRQLRVLTAHGRMTGWILASLPPAMAAYMFISNPEHLNLLLTDPLGIKMVITALCLQVFGAFLIYKISDVEYQTMPTSTLLTLAAVFGAAALLTGTIVAIVMTRSSAVGRRRLEEMSQQPRTTVIVQAQSLTPTSTSTWDVIAETLPTSRGTLKRLRRDLALAGWVKPETAAILSICEIVLPLTLAAIPFIYLTGFNRWIAVGLSVAVGYMAPGFILTRRINKRKKQIQNGLADLLDLLVLCLEAGSGLDQAIVKASEELRVAYPALADQLQILISEMRAGKPRIEAFKGLADRSQVDDVRAMVSMLAQTDRFGTSISQSLRQQADVCRTKRRQRAEEKAQKVSVKLVFPLVFCLFPALYVVLLGPAFIQFGRVLGSK